MTKKHFIELANYLTDEALGQYCQVIDGQVNIDDLREHLANYCHAQNHHFMRSRWLDYIAGKCGKNGGKVRAA